MSTALLQELLRAGRPCVLVTVAETRGSVPRAAGAKMVVYADGAISGTIGGGKFEALVVAEALQALAERRPILKTFPLHEGDAASFGAICGGEVTVLIEPQTARETLVLIGAGHCAQALAHFATACGWAVTVVDDRADLLAACPSGVQRIGDCPASDFIRQRSWQGTDALVLVSRNFEIDREALFAALPQTAIGYLGMIGSERKVRRVFSELRERGVTAEQLARVHAPIGLDIGADSPGEIAISVLAEILQQMRGRPGGSLCRR